MISIWNYYSISLPEQWNRSCSLSSPQLHNDCHGCLLVLLQLASQWIWGWLHWYGGFWTCKWATGITKCWNHWEFLWQPLSVAMLCHSLLKSLVHCVSSVLKGVKVVRVGIRDRNWNILNQSVLQVLAVSSNYPCLTPVSKDLGHELKLPPKPALMWASKAQAGVIRQCLNWDGFHFLKFARPLWALWSKRYHEKCWKNTKAGHWIQTYNMASDAF